MKNHPFPEGTFVETTDNYYELFGRRVRGIVEYLNGKEPPECMTVVRWLYQEGNVIDQHQNNIVVMLTSDLQKQVVGRYIISVDIAN